MRRAANKSQFPLTSRRAFAAFEYGLLSCLMGATIVTGATFAGSSLNSVFGTLAAYIQDPVGSRNPLLAISQKMAAVNRIRRVFANQAIAKCFAHLVCCKVPLYCKFHRHASL